MKYSCKLCSQIFSTKSNYNRHINKEELCINKKQLNEFIILQNTSIDELNVLVEDQNKIIQEQIVQEFVQEFVEEPVEQELKFDGIFQGREKEIRITPDKMISVFDFIKVVSGQTQPRKTWLDIKKTHKDEVVTFCNDFKFEGSGQRLTPVVNVQGMVKLLFLLPGEMAKQFRSKSAEVMIRYLGGDQELVNQLYCELIQEPIQELIQEPVEPIQELAFDGIFQGREHEIRITSNKQVSVFDFIKVVGGQANPRKTWADILKNHKEEVVTFCYNLKFPGIGQKLTPVVNVQGMVKLLFLLPGETAKQFRSKSAEVMIRYLGGDITLIDEIKAIDQEHIVNPNNIAQVFREEVVQQQKLLFNQDQINTSKRLINYYGDKRDIFYMFSFKYLEEWYVKYGMVGEVRDFYERVKQHISEFEEICFHNVLQCSNINKVESDFKETALVSMNKVKIPKKYGGNHTEIIKLSEIVTTEVIREEMYKVAGNRMIDPPPRYTYTQQIENSDSEKTKQIEYQEVTKQIECQEVTKQIECQELTKQKEIETDQERERTKQKEIELEIKRMEFEIMKLQMSKGIIIPS